MTDTLRQAIADSRLPMLTLAQRTGIVRQSLMRFAAGDSSLRLDLADKVAAYFGIDCNRGGKQLKAHDRGTKGFRELSLSQMRASMGAMQKHLNRMKKIYAEEKGNRSSHKSP